MPPETTPGLREKFVPALGLHTLTRFFDPVVRIVLDDEGLKRRLIETARIEPGHRVLDLGCGTGTLLELIARSEPGAHIEGLDADREILAIARRKLAGSPVVLHQALAAEAALGAESYDRILSSLFFHHLPRAVKLEVLERCLGWLRPGGELHVLDWGRAANLLMRAAFLPVQLLDGFARTGDNVRGELVSLMRRAGFVEAAERSRKSTLLGTISFYSARKK
jgi:2-polyprenyl-3-methyl-5-hydroxy-6-metoxy-1,4-benzoquinol methylase